MASEDFLIRDEAPEDAAVVRTLFEAAVRSSYPALADLSRSEARDAIEYQLAWYRDRPHRVRLVIVSGETAGGCWCMPSHHPVTGASDLFLVMVAVLPAYRGRGLGRALVEDARAMASRLGRSCLRLFVHSANEPALGLYRALGFETATVEMVLPTGGRHA